MEQSGALFSVALSAQECERTTGFADREESLARTRGSRIGSKQLAHAWPSTLIGIKPVRDLNNRCERLAGDRCDCSKARVHRAGTVPDNRVECSHRGRGHAGILLTRLRRSPEPRPARRSRPSDSPHPIRGRPLIVRSTVHSPSCHRPCARRRTARAICAWIALKLRVDQDDPSPLTTTQKVRARILASSLSDHSAAYWTSRATRSA